MIANLFTRCSGRLPEPPAPKAEMPPTMVVELWDPARRKHVPYLQRWNGEKYVIEKELSRV